MNNKLITKVALIGGGPACATAAIQLVRSGIESILIAKEIGGIARNANLIENLLGYPYGITGDEFVSQFKLQLTKIGVPIILEEVRSVKRVDQKFILKTEESEIHSEYLLIGTGSKPKRLNIEGEFEAFQEKKLFYEMYNAKEETSEKDVIIIGSGDAAYDYTMNIAKSAKKISILHRTSQTKSLPLLQKRVKKHENVSILRNHIPIQIRMKEESLALKAQYSEETKEIPADIILVAIGREPIIDFLSDELKEEYEKQPIGSNLLFIGDVKNQDYRQISIAMGDGMKAAMETVKRIIEMDD